ncbi:MAG: hypothetical protein WAM91_04435 [Candidatus Acidiferrales bacterium]
METNTLNVTSEGVALAGSELKTAETVGRRSVESPVHRTIGAGALSVFNLGLKIVSNFILILVALKFLGREEYGLWILLQSLATYLALSELGISQTVCNFQNVAFARGDYKQVGRILVSTFWLYCLIVAIAAILFSGVVLTQPVNVWFLKDPGSVSAPKFAMYLFLAGTFALLRVPLTVFPVTLVGLREVALRQVLETVSAISLLVFTLGALIAGGKILALILATNLAYMLAQVLGYALTRTRHPEVRFSLSLLDKSLMGPIFGNSIFFFLYGLGLLFQRLAGTLIGGKYGALGDVPALFVLLTLFRIVGWSLAEIPSQTLQPYVILFSTRGEHDRVVFLARLCTKLTFAIGAAYVAGVWIFADMGIRAWLGPGMFLGYGPLICLGVSFLIDILFLSTNNFMRGLNEHRKLSIVMAGYALLSFTFGVAGAKWWMPNQPLYGLCVGLLVASVLGQALTLPWIAKAWLRVDWQAYGGSFLFRPGLSIVFVILAALFAERSHGWWRSAGFILVLLGSFSFMSWRFVLDLGERSWLTSRIGLQRLLMRRAPLSDPMC